MQTAAILVGWGGFGKWSCLVFASFVVKRVGLATIREILTAKFAKKSRRERKGGAESRTLRYRFAAHREAQVSAQTAGADLGEWKHERGRWGLH